MEADGWRISVARVPRDGQLAPVFTLWRLRPPDEARALGLRVNPYAREHAERVGDFADWDAAAQGAGRADNDLSSRSETDCACYKAKL